MAEGNKRKYSVPAVDGMLDILEFMSETQRPCGVTELSRELGISTNLAFRILKRLTERGYTEIEAESGAYCLSSRFFTLGMKLYSRFELRVRARAHLEALCRETGETCQIQIPDSEMMLTLDCVNPPKDFYLHVVPGSRLYSHANAFGKAVLAFIEPDEAKKFLKKMPKLTKNTTSSEKKLFDEFKKICQSGLAYDNEEYNDGVFCIGSPVFNVSGEVVAGIGVTGLSSRFDEKNKPEFERMVLKCAEDLSKDIGYSGDFFSKLKA
jgi:IclR family acetate operon transcriptional repressor